MSNYWLIIDDSQMTIFDIYDRLLSVMVTDILYTEVLQKDIIKNAIVIQSELTDEEIYHEIQDILYFIGYRGDFEIVKPIKK